MNIKAIIFIICLFSFSSAVCDEYDFIQISDFLKLVRLNDIDNVKRSIEKDKNIISYGITYKNDIIRPIGIAVHEGHTDIAKLLIDNGANIHERDSYGNNLLVYALESNNIEIIRLLLINGINPNNENKIGLTPLAYSIINNNDIEIIKLLLQYGANPNYINKDGFPVFFMSIEFNRVDILTLFNEGNCDLSMTANNGRTCYHEAFICGYVDMIKYLMSIRVKTKMYDINGDTPLDTIKLNKNLSNTAISDLNMLFNKLLEENLLLK